MQLGVSIADWREQRLASTSGSFEKTFWLLLEIFFGGRPLRFVVLVVVELDVDWVLESLDDRGFCFCCFFCSFSFSFMSRNSSSVMFIAVVFVKRLARIGLDWELIFSNSFFRSGRSVFTTRRTVLIGVEEEGFDWPKLETSAWVFLRYKRNTHLRLSKDEMTDALIEDLLKRFVFLIEISMWDRAGMVVKACRTMW